MTSSVLKCEASLQPPRRKTCKVVLPNFLKEECKDAEVIKWEEVMALRPEERGWKTFFAVAVRRETVARREIEALRASFVCSTKVLYLTGWEPRKGGNPGTAQKNSLFVCPPAPIAFIVGSPPFKAPLTPTPATRPPQERGRKNEDWA